VSAPSVLPLAGKVVLVTGSARRVGAVIVRCLHAAGASVGVHYGRSEAAAHALVNDLNALRTDSAACWAADLRRFAAAEPLIAAVLAHFGRLDELVNNASTFYPTPLAEIDEAAWNDLVGTNFMAPLLLCQAAAPALRQAQGAVVNITDIHAERPLPGYPLYCAAKGALLTLTRALAIELAPSVRVNAVAPGPILWPSNDSFDAAARRDIIEHTLLKHEGSAQDIASAVRFLLSDAAYITGQVINVDGGRTAHL
jgi:pteridine reductase